MTSGWNLEAGVQMMTGGFELQTFTYGRSEVERLNFYAVYALQESLLLQARCVRKR